MIPPREQPTPSALTKRKRRRRALLIAPFALAALAVAGCGGSNGTLPLLSGGAGSTHTAAIEAAPVFGVSDAVSGARSVAPLALTWPKGAPANGDVLVACVESQWQATPVTPAGWTSLYAAGASTFGTALVYRIANAEPATVTFAIPTPYNISAAMIRVSGAAAVAPLWSHAAVRNASTLNTSGLVPNALGMLPIACFGGVNATTFSAAAGWTLGAANTGGYATMIEQRQTLTADLQTPVSVAASAAAKSANIDGYGLLIASAAPATPPPSAPPSALHVVDAGSGFVFKAPLTVTWPKGRPAQGDLLVACAESQWQALPQTPSGWTALYAANATFGTALFYKIAGAAEPASVGFGIPSPYNISASIVRITGAAASAPLWSHAANAGLATLASQSIVPNVLGMLPLACFGGVNAGSYTTASGWSLTTHDSNGYATSIEQRQSDTSDITSPISVSATTSNGAASTTNDAFGILVAPAAITATGPIGLDPSSVAFQSPQAASVTVAATEPGITAFSASGTSCSGIATLVTNGGGRFTLSPVATGSCSFTIRDASGHTAVLPVSTTSTVVNVR